MGGRNVRKHSRRAITFEHCQFSGLDLARFCPEKSQKKYESGGRMWETFPMYLVYIFISTEGHSGVRGAANHVFAPQMNLALYLSQ